MTTKPIFLNQFHQYLAAVSSLFSMPPAVSSIIWFLIFLGGFFSLISFIPIKAQDTHLIIEDLPPPPPVSSSNRALRTRYHQLRQPSLQPPTYQDSPEQREYNFRAPDDLTTPSELPASRSYRVEVFGNSETLLNRVRNIEPTAFRKGDVIQVGIFSEQQNAEAILRKLALEGLWARIVVNE
ncbi:SPOR domain-containing protein [Pleurocapsales cyanobacterium LEGE 06147]|nr:SPOR domain-containing protein [Pleurocapsales cyanobacterium LEGE 06147]